jgi:hypothetical protein
MSKNWRRTKEYRMWRASVIRRDKRCVVCGTIHNRQAHHMNHATYFQDERYDMDNGVTLCTTCHMQFHCNYKRSYQTKCTKYDFNNFMDLVKYLMYL